MILLEVANRAVAELLSDKFENPKERINFTLGDFDGVMYHISDSGSNVLVSINLRFFEELKQYGVMKFLKQEYGDLLLANPETGYSVTLSINMDNLPQDRVELANKCARLKRTCLAAVFYNFFDLQPTVTSSSQLHRGVINLSDSETLCIQAMQDRVTVIFSVTFPDPDELLVGKLFLQEMGESRQRWDRAPQFLFSYRVPPAELKGTNVPVGENVAYLTLVLHPRHLKPGSVRETAINLVSMLPTYLHYHIKCSKAHLQSRMRAKTQEFIKVINRARPNETKSTAVTVPPIGEFYIQQQPERGSKASGVQSG